MKLRDERGAILVIGLFMAVFLVGALYYMVGIAEAITHRERMQDAADAAAFSGATLHARGMNLIVLINLVMAALLAILVTLKLLQALILAAILAIGVAGAFLPGLAVYIPPLRVLNESVSKVHDRLRPPINRSLELLHTLARGVRVAVPAVAQARTVGLVTEHYSPPAQIGFLVPTRLELPTKDGTFDELCNRAGDFVGDLVALPLMPLVPGAVRGVVSDAASELVQAGMGWFCGAGGSPPSVTLRHTVQQPMLPSRQECAEMQPGTSGYSEQKHDAACAQAEEDEEASKPDDYGDCTDGCDEKLLAARAALARQACEPVEGRRLSKFSWVERDYQAVYRMRGGHWEQQPAARTPGRLIRDGERPCGGGTNTVGDDWNTGAGPGTNPSSAVCSRTEPELPRNAPDGDEMTVRVHEVSEVFGCTEEIVVKHQVGADNVSSGAQSGGEKRVPQDLADDAELGEEVFQVRAVVLGDLPSDSEEKVVEVASWGSKPSGLESAELGPLSAARQLGRMAVAQAEYYYAVKNPKSPERGDFMWNMRWQARLRRVRAIDRDPAQSQSQSAPSVPGLDVPESTTDPAAACSQAGGAGGSCDGIDLSSMEDLVIH
jgi:hypothetical protein